jgi:hypothetical protein
VIRGSSFGRIGAGPPGEPCRDAAPVHRRETPKRPSREGADGEALRCRGRSRGRHVRRRSLSATLAGLVLANAPAGAQTRAAFVFTAIPDQDETRLVERFTRIADHLRQRLGVPVRYLPVKSYPAAVTAFTNNQVQLAWFGGFTGVQARRAVPGSEAIAQGAEDAAFRSYVIANAKTGLQPSRELPREIAGRSFTFGARASTSGRLMPEFFLRQGFGKAPDEIFSRVGFSATIPAPSNSSSPAPSRSASSTTPSGTPRRRPARSTPRGSG